MERLNTGHRSLNIAFPLTPATVNHHKQTLKDDMSEFMMTGLRLTQAGVSFSEFERRSGKSLIHVFGKEIDELLKLGLIEKVQTSEILVEPGQNKANSTEISEALRLTKRGRLLGNQVFMRFV